LLAFAMACQPLDSDRSILSEPLRPAVSGGGVLSRGKRAPFIDVIRLYSTVNQLVRHKLSNESRGMGEETIMIGWPDIVDRAAFAVPVIGGDNIGERTR
jgi:hypothetical protein